MAEPQLGTVRGRYRITEGEGTRAARGRVSFTPLQPEGSVDVPEATRYARGRVDAVFDASGWIHLAGTTATELRMPAGLWSVEFAADGLEISPFPFELPVGGTANLPALQPLVPSPHVEFVVNQEVYTLTLAAKEDAERFAGTASSAAGVAVAARDETIVAVSDLEEWAAGARALTQEATRSKYLRRRLTGNVTLSLAAGVAGLAYSCALELTQDATGNRSIVLTNVAASKGVPIFLSAAANAVDIVRLEWNGSRWSAFLGGDGMSVPPTWVV